MYSLRKRRQEAEARQAPRERPGLECWGVGCEEQGFNPAALSPGNISLFAPHTVGLGAQRGIMWPLGPVGFFSEPEVKTNTGWESQVSCLSRCGGLNLGVSGSEGALGCRRGEVKRKWKGV